MTPTSLFILTTCCLTAILAIVLLLWHRESRRLGASNADAEARERAAAALTCHVRELPHISDADRAAGGKEDEPESRFEFFAFH